MPSNTALDILQDITKATQRNRSEYTPEVKLKALQTYAAYGSMQQVEKRLGIPWKTVQSWKRLDWWKSNIEAVREEADDKLDGMFTNVVHKATEAIEDRLSNGDERVDKNGDTYRVKVGARDLSIIAGTLYDKRNLVRGKTTTGASAQTTLDDMANMFKQFAKEHTEQHKTTQVEEKVVNSIPGSSEVIDDSKDNEG